MVIDNVKEILVGYCDPAVKAISPSPVGSSGLTVRMYNIVRLWEMSVAFRRRQFWRFACTWFVELFAPLIGSIEVTWMTEVLRIMDRAESPVPRKGMMPNLTVEQCHNRFQKVATLTDEQRRQEQTLFDSLMANYDSAKLRDFRNQQMFHLDLKEMLASAGGIYGVETMTARLIDWYKYAGTVGYGGEPRYVTVGAVKSGRNAAKEFRRMMVARVRGMEVKADRWRAAHPELKGILKRPTREEI